MHREIYFAAAGLVAAAGAFWLWRYWHRLTPEQIECARRLRLNAIGRIAAGEILEMLPAPVPGGENLPPLLVYQYEFAGVTYQASQALHMVPVPLDPAAWIPGWPAQVKFDPANPGNSIIACEHWVGIRNDRARSAPA
ncbi:MAG TPA: hypothetical protein VN690_03575 [Terriglobales bacterium]|nr:hypothetical protein [Terriglobales bacterium]